MPGFHASGTAAEEFDEDLFQNGGDDEIPLSANITIDKAKASEEIIDGVITRVGPTRGNFVVLEVLVTIDSLAKAEHILGEGQITAWQRGQLDNGHEIRIAVTVPGRLQMGTAAVDIGDRVEAVGQWHAHPDYGRQFKAGIIILSQQGDHMSLGMVLRWLPRVPGVGVATINRLKEGFGETLPAIIDNQTALHEVLEASGQPHAARIAANIVAEWEKANNTEATRDMLWLVGIGFGLKTAQNIVHALKTNIRSTIMENPWVLCEVVDRIGFLTSDRVAIATGTAMDTPQRLESAITYVLRQAENEGHCGLPTAWLGTRLCQLTGLSPEIVKNTIRRHVVEGRLKASLCDEEKMLLRLPDLDQFERLIADTIEEFVLFRASSCDMPSDQVNLGQPCPDTIDMMMQWAGKMALHEGKPLNTGQEQAIRTLLSENIMALTGPPGVGKTTVLRYACAALQQFWKNNYIMRPILGAAMAGRAAQRMGDSLNGLGIPTSTIYRLLGWTSDRYWSTGLHCHLNKQEFDAILRDDEQCESLSLPLLQRLADNGYDLGEIQHKGSGFIFDRYRPLDAGLVLVDECSMPDIRVMGALFDALSPEQTRLVLIGDRDQLNPIGAGKVYHDIIESGVVPIVRLTEIVRSGDAIAQAVKNIGQGVLPPACAKNGPWKRRQEADVANIIANVIHTVSEELPSRGFDMKRGEIQVLTPMRRGPLGTIALNRHIKNAVNPLREGEPMVKIAGGDGDPMIYTVGDRVMQIANNYQLGVMNGEQGTIIGIETSKKDGLTIIVDFGIANTTISKIHEDDARSPFGNEGREDAPDTVRRYSYTEFSESITMCWAATVHKLQGSEARAVITVLNDQHFRMLLRPMLYTAASRGREVSIVIGSDRAFRRALTTQDSSCRHGHLLPRLKEIRAKAERIRQIRMESAPMGAFPAPQNGEDIPLPRFDCL